MIEKATTNFAMTSSFAHNIGEIARALRRYDRPRNYPPPQSPASSNARRLRGGKVIIESSGR